MSAADLGNQVEARAGRQINRKLNVTANWTHISTRVFLRETRPDRRTDFAAAWMAYNV